MRDGIAPFMAENRATRGAVQEVIWELKRAEDILMLLMLPSLY